MLSVRRTRNYSNHLRRRSIFFWFVSRSAWFHGCQACFKSVQFDVKIVYTIAPKITALAPVLATCFLMSAYPSTEVNHPVFQPILDARRTSGSATSTSGTVSRASPSTSAAITSPTAPTDRTRRTAVCSSCPRSKSPYDVFIPATHKRIRGLRRYSFVRP